ncbi:MAG: CAP domain-containing protein [Alphaproteobacteria bacterium]|nr:CAP domain-containing protein [Alphaproteobacteria bacterium]
MVSRRTLILTTPVFFLAPRLAVAEVSPERMAERLIAEAVNAGRARMAPDLPPLAGEAVLDAIARERSAAMAAGAPFDHQDADGGYPAIQKMRTRYAQYGAMGENIAMDFEPSRNQFDPRYYATRMVDEWFKSEAHRENILSPAFTRCGTGVARSPGRTTVYATQVFWGPPVFRRSQRG